MNGRKMTKEEAVAHMKQMMEKMGTADLAFHMEVIGLVLAERASKENEGKNLVMDLSHMKVMQ